MSHKDLYIIDNAVPEQTVRQYLDEWCSVSRQLDIATGYLEIGGLLSLDGKWQQLDKIRIILGNEVTRRTKEVIDAAVQAILNTFKNSVDVEQEKNDFLVGVASILRALSTGKIECRVYDKNKFHAKAYITYFRDEYRKEFIKAMNIPKGYALVGSSNFTKAGLTQNIELNVQVRDDVDQLQDWFEKHWEQGIDITDSLFRVLEAHCAEYSPYDIYLRSMYEYFKTREETICEWENNESAVYPRLAQYQRDGYNSLVEIAEQFGGALLCDGVGLGKTYEGLMLIERFVKKERKNVVLIVPAAARVSVWEVTIKKYIPEILEGFYPFKIINHTDLLLEKNKNLMDQITQQAEIIIIDEAHHFRNRTSNRYKKLFQIMGAGMRKQLFMLTATPINNSFLDLQHLIELFTQRQEDYFSAAPLGIHSLSGHFRKMESKLQSLTDSSDLMDATEFSDDIFRGDILVNKLVVQRSRAYVKRSLSNKDGSDILFSIRQAPTVANYSLKKSYGKLIDDFIASFYRHDKNGNNFPILSLAVYSPYDDAYYIGDKTKLDDMVKGRQTQIVNLIRQLLLKRFESSIAAFEETCIRIYMRLKKFLVDYKNFGNARSIDRLLSKHADIIEYINCYINKIEQQEIDEYEDSLPEYVWNDETDINVEDFDIRTMLEDTILDMEVLAEFVKDIMAFDADNDDKIRELKRLLSEDEHLKGKKVIIFSEYTVTARYIYKELLRAGFNNVFELDGTVKVDRHDIIQRFAPYYNGSTSSEIQDEIEILIATDVLAEGLNLQDASCLINYELHWNPVRLMQRIGRVDRRRDAHIEDKLLRDHPELCSDRSNAYYWNFLPPEELEKLLSLYRTVSQKTLRISRTFGIEGKKLLTPEDDYDALRDFNSQYEGDISSEEEMALEYQKLLADNPNYENRVQLLPKKMFSCKQHKKYSGYFFCYELPTQKSDSTWSNGDGIYRWYLYDIHTDTILEQTYEIWHELRCEKTDPKIHTESIEEYNQCKKKIEAYINKGYMRNVQAPIGVKPRLVTWMQLH